MLSKTLPCLLSLVALVGLTACSSSRSNQTAPGNASGAGGGGMGGAPSAQPSSVAWSVTGELEEACSCNPACPCWFASKPTMMNCSGVQMIFINKGRYGKTKLDGLAFGNFVQSPDNETMMDSFGRWTLNHYYIDERATPEQREALKAIALQVLMGDATPPDQRKFTYAPITRTISGNEHIIKVGDVSIVSAHLTEGGLGGPAVITNPPGADPLHHQYMQGATTNLTYNDGGQKWSFKNSNYMFAKFDIDNREYEKYAVGLAQKMEAAKKQ